MTSPFVVSPFTYGDAPNGGVVMPTVIATRDPGNQDKYEIGYQWVNKSNNSYWVLTGFASGLPIWSSGGNNPATTTDYGTVILTDNSEPVATKVYVDNIAISGAPAWSETISGIGQLSTNAEALAGTDDNTAMTPLKVAAVFATPFAIGSGTPAAGAFTTVDATGLLTALAGATIDTAGAEINLASDNDGASVNIGTDGDRIMTIGNVVGSTALVLRSGTGGVNIVSTGTGDLTFNSADTVLIDSAGVLELNSSAGVIGIGNDAVAQAINIGTGAAARTVTIGNGSGASSVVLNSGTGAINIGTNAVAHTVSLGNGTGATSVVIDSGTGPINVGTNAVAHTVTIGNITGATAVNVNTGTGGTTYTTTNGIFTLATGTGAISVSADAAATTLNIGTGAAAKTVNLGSTNTTSTTTINSGSGNVNVTGGHLAIASVAKTLLVNGGAVTDFIGTGTLVLGTETIANTNIAAGDVILLTRTGVAASTTLGELVYSISAGVSFTVRSAIVGTPGSNQTGDVSTYAYFIVRPT